MIALAALPLLWPPIPPLTDVPGHMGAYRVMLGGGGPAIDQAFAFRWEPIGYLGGEIAVRALAPLFGLELSVKLMMIAIPMATVAGALWVSREAHGRVQPLALLALPLAYNLAFQMGFVNYTLAMAMMLNALALWMRLGRLGHLRMRASLFVPLSVLVWLGHFFAWVVLGLLAFCVELMRERSAGRGWIAAAWHAGLGCLPLSLPFLMFLRWQPGGTSAQDYWSSLARKPVWLTSALRDRWAAFDILSIGAIVAAIYAGLRFPAFRRSPELLAGAAGLFLLFLVMPFSAAYADARLLPFVLMIAILAIGTSQDMPASRQRTLAALALSFVVVRMGAGTVSLLIESRDWERHLRALDHLPRNTRVAAFVMNSCTTPWTMERLNHLPSMAIVRRGSFTNDQWSFGGTGTLKIRAKGIVNYDSDPSQMVTRNGCLDSRSLDQALARLPRTRFDHVWLIGAEGFQPAMIPWLVPLWADRGDFLFRIDPARLSDRPQSN